jgi:hypothetical protein
MVGVLVVIVLVATAFMIWWVREVILASRPGIHPDRPGPSNPDPQPQQT